MSDEVNKEGERIAKLLARAGAGSRRDIERMIVEGRVKRDGVPLLSPAVNLLSLDGITVDGRAVEATEAVRLWRYHKPKGLITTHKDPQGRKTIFEALPSHLGRVISVGRLDLNTEGLLLLTNDGDLARWMELPETGLARRYRVRVYGTVDHKALARLIHGIHIDGVDYEPIEAKADKQEGANTWIDVMIKEGKNREVRRVMSHLGLTVNRLLRLSYGPFALGTLERGATALVPVGKLEEAIAPFLDKHPNKKVGELNQRNRGAWAKAKSDENPLHKMKRRKVAEAKAKKVAEAPRRKGRKLAD